MRKVASLVPNLFPYEVYLLGSFFHSEQTWVGLLAVPPGAPYCPDSLLLWGRPPAFAPGASRVTFFPEPASLECFWLLVSPLGKVTPTGSISPNVKGGVCRQDSPFLPRKPPRLDSSWFSRVIKHMLTYFNYAEELDGIFRGVSFALGPS